MEFRNLMAELDLNIWSFRVKKFLDAAGVLKPLNEEIPVAVAEKAKFEEIDIREQNHLL